MKSISTWDTQANRSQIARSFQLPALERPVARKPSFLQRLAGFLTGSSDPTISLSQRHGQTEWNVYDPQSGRKQRFSSEEDIRYWMEQRYNH